MLMPMVGMGVWQYNSSQAEASVSMGLAKGVRSFDTAQTYKNQDGVGAAIRKSAVLRQEIRGCHAWGAHSLLDRRERTLL